MNLGLRLGLGGAGVSAAAAIPVTTNFTFSQIGSGWGFSYNDTTDATRRYFSAHTESSNAPNTNSIWVGVATGSELKVTLGRSSSGTFNNVLEARIDGGSWASIAGPTTGTSGTVTVYTGLSDSAHLVELRFWSAISPNIYYWPKTGTVATVTGVSPAITPYTGWRLPGSSEGDTVSTNSLKASTANYYPPNVVLHPTTTGVTANNPSLSVKADYTTMVIAATGRYVYYSVDTGAPVRIDRGSGFTFGSSVVTGLSGTHTYNVWTGDFTTAWLSVGGLFGGTGVQSDTRGRFDQYGDSITYGQGADSPGDTDTFIVAAALNRVAGNFGHSGWKIADITAAIDALLAGKTITSADVAVIAIGYNDGNTALSTQQQSDYTYIINACLTKGYGLVICRGVHVSTSGGVYTTFNNSLSSFVTGIANPKVKFLDPATYVPSVVATADGLHPTAAGYVTLAANYLPGYQALGA